MEELASNASFDYLLIIHEFKGLVSVNVPTVDKVPQVRKIMTAVILILLESYIPRPIQFIINLQQAINWDNSLTFFSLFERVRQQRSTF
jgi:hypothetical protein